jgi:hypothetical protein
MYSGFRTTTKYERARMMRDNLVKNGDGFLGCTFLTFCKIITHIQSVRISTYHQYRFQLFFNSYNFINDSASEPTFFLQTFFYLHYTLFFE